MADAEILQGEIEAVQEAILSVDQRLDELEEGDGNSPVNPEPITQSPPTPLIDMAQSMGRLEAQVAECQSQIAALTQQLASTQGQAEAALEMAAETLETEDILETPEVVEVEPEPSSSVGSEEPKPNWLERLLLGR